MSSLPSPLQPCMASGVALADTLCTLRLAAQTADGPVLTVAGLLLLSRDDRDWQQLCGGYCVLVSSLKGQRT